MTDWRGFRGAAKRIEDIDIPRIAATIGVGEDEIHAFMDVEAAGAGFDGTGRPKMLFEPHVFYRNLTGAKRAEAVKAGLAYAKWRRNYPKDSYPRLVAAMAIDETAALKSASWGLGQILGENHKMVGYATPQAMVGAFMEDEETHLEAIVAFLKAAKLDDNLRAHDWAGVANGYNGAGYAANGYHTRMARAFAMWRKIKDTPWSPGDATKPIPSDPDGARPTLRVGDGITRNIDLQPYVREAQELLGLTADGKFGEATKAAVKTLQRSRGLTEDGVIGGQTWTALLDRPKSDPLHVPPPASAEPAAPEPGGAKTAGGAAVVVGGTGAAAAASSGRWGLAIFIGLLALVAGAVAFIVLRKKG